MTSKLLLALYHTLLKQARMLTNTSKSFYPRAPLDKSLTAVEPYPALSRDYEQRVLQHLVNNMDSTLPVQVLQFPQVFPCSGQWLYQEIQRQFRASTAGLSAHAAADRCFSFMRMLAHQLQLERCSSRACTEGVLVDLTTNFLGPCSMGFPVPGNTAYRLHQFQYRVRIVNLREDSVQLTGRHWLFTDAEGQETQGVPKWGNGVIGRQPVIPAGEAIEYFSHAPLPTSTTRMQGAFLCRAGSGAELEVEVAPARLVGPADTVADEDEQ